jgi:hypothetical protein
MRIGLGRDGPERAAPGRTGVEWAGSDRTGPLPDHDATVRADEGGLDPGAGVGIRVVAFRHRAGVAGVREVADQPAVGLTVGTAWQARESVTDHLTVIRTVVTIFGEAIEVWTGHGPIR